MKLENDKPLTLLVTCCQSPYLTGTVNCYREFGNGIRIIGCDMNKMVHNFAGYDGFYQVSAVKDEQYIDELIDICKKEKIDLIVPIHTNELERIADNIERFKAIGTDALISDAKAIRIANDKIKLYDFLDRNGFNVPKSMITDNAEFAIEFMRRFHGTPFVIKEAHECGGIGLYVVKNGYEPKIYCYADYIGIEDVKNVIKDDKLMIIQEFLVGQEYSVDLVCDNGKAVLSAVRHNIVVAGSPRNSVVEEDFGISAEPKKVAELLKFDGCIDFDIKCDEAGKPYIIDCNPRNAATLSLIHKAGMNMPLAALRMKIGMTPYDEEPKLVYGTRILRKMTDYFFTPDMELIE